MTLLVLKHQTRTDEQAPEFRYLLSLTVARARAVFDAVDSITWHDGDPEPPASKHDYVLILGAANTWLTVNTLRQMRDAVDAGAQLAAPAPLSSFDLGRYEPLYTARDFEQLERRLHEDLPHPQVKAPSHLPVSLLSGPAYALLCREIPLSRFLVDPVLPPNAFNRAVWDAGVALQFIDYYGEVRADLLPFLPEAAEDVLEVGCGRGHTGKLIQDRLGCRVTGVELNPEIAADAARRLWRVISGDVLTVAIDGRYDAIVASELVEHVVDVDALLLRLKSLLRPGGRIVISIPNVGHYSLVDDLIAGRWDYVPVGLLCSTHVRFFTRHTLTEWMTRLGFRCEIVPQKTEVPERFAAMPAGFETDLESLATKGFYVTLTEP